MGVLDEEERRDVKEGETRNGESRGGSRALWEEATPSSQPISGPHVQRHLASVILLLMHYIPIITLFLVYIAGLSISRPWDHAGAALPSKFY